MTVTSRRQWKRPAGAIARVTSLRLAAAQTVATGTPTAIAFDTVEGGGLVSLPTITVPASRRYKVNVAALVEIAGAGKVTVSARDVTNSIDLATGVVAADVRPPSYSLDLASLPSTDIKVGNLDSIARPFTNDTDAAMHADASGSLSAAISTDWGDGSDAPGINEFYEAKLAAPGFGIGLYGNDPWDAGYAHHRSGAYLSAAPATYSTLEFAGTVSNHNFNVDFTGSGGSAGQDPIDMPWELYLVNLGAIGLTTEDVDLTGLARTLIASGPGVAGSPDAFDETIGNPGGGPNWFLLLVCADPATIPAQLWFRDALATSSIFYDAQHPFGPSWLYPGSATDAGHRPFIFQSGLVVEVTDLTVTHNPNTDVPTTKNVQPQARKRVYLAAGTVLGGRITQDTGADATVLASTGTMLQLDPA